MPTDNKLVYENGDLLIVTVEVDDHDPSIFETGVQHPDYNDNRWVVVEEYPEWEQARAGHRRWIATFVHGMPDHLIEVGTSMIPNMIDQSTGSRAWRTMVRRRERSSDEPSAG